MEATCGNIRPNNSLRLTKSFRAKRFSLSRQRRQAKARKPKNDNWRAWLEKHFAKTTHAGFSERHVEFWDWVWNIRKDERPRPMVAIWPRGGGKSTSAELAVAAIGTRGIRRYCIYVCETQAQADDHVASIANKLESLGVERKLDKYGQSEGWRRNRLRTKNFTVDALGLDVASRGKKIDDDRPDLIIFDDIDNQNDSPKMIAKKKKTIKSSILPAMATGCAVLFCQNLIHANSIAAELADGRADFLVDRIVSGPHKAATTLKTDPVETNFDGQFRIRHIVDAEATTPTWQGQGIEQIQAAIDTYGLRDFLTESQHDVYEREGALWSRATLAECHAAVPERFKRVVVGVDPSGGGDEIGIIVAGLGHDGRAYVLADRTCKGKHGTLAWGKAVAKAYHDFGADKVVAEKNFGGDMVESNIKVADNTVAVKMVSASRGKDVRAEPVASLYGEPEQPGGQRTPPRVFHCVVCPELETEMTTWTPSETWSPNRMDALVWVLTELMLNGSGQGFKQSIGRR